MRPSQVAVLVFAAAGFVGVVPRVYGYIDFAFGDLGWALTVDALLDEGLRPVTDFGYFYGLLTLVVDRAVFAAVGRTPVAVLALNAACALAVAAGIVRVMRAVNVTGPPAAFLAVVAPLAVMPILFPSPAHALEAALLANALADHAARRPGRALALVTVAVFVKPSLGYVYGLILLVLILAGWPGGGRWRRLIPATAVGTAILVTMVAVFGWEPVFRTQLPLDGSRAYRESGFGFLFGSGRQFWDPGRPDVLFYLFKPVGVWLASSAVLVALAVRLLPRWREAGPNVVLTCTALHLVFVFALFGNEWSWIYYAYILFVGTAVGLSALSPAEDDASLAPAAQVGRRVAVVLTTLAVAGQVFSVWIGDARSWVIHRRSAEVGGLYALPDHLQSLAEARDLGRTGRVFVLTRMGAAHLLTPEFDTPRTWCLARATATPAELDRVRERIAAADWILAPAWHDNDLMDWPELADAVRPFQEDKDRNRPLYKLYRRGP